MCPPIFHFVILIDSKMSVVYQRFCNRCNFFEYPVQSHFLGIYKVWNLGSEFRIGSIENITTKNVILPYKEGFVVIPALHTRFSGK